MKRYLLFALLMMMKSISLLPPFFTEKLELVNKIIVFSNGLKGLTLEGTKYANTENILDVLF
jgi:hypothetical protein